MCELRGQPSLIFAGVKAKYICIDVGSMIEVMGGYSLLTASIFLIRKMNQDINGEKVWRGSCWGVEKTA